MINFKRVFALTLTLIVYAIQQSRAQFTPVPTNGRHISHGMADEATNKARIATKLKSVNWFDLDRYGRQIDGPLMVKFIGPVTDLYAAIAPKRSFVGTIDGGFYKDRSGKITYRDDAAIGVIAV